MVGTERLVCRSAKGVLGLYVPLSGFVKACDMSEINACGGMRPDGKGATFLLMHLPSAPSHHRL
eukprot:SAG11_NODE_573_length_8438_cov_22.469601_5_plen_64_part_00